MNDNWLIRKFFPCKIGHNESKGFDALKRTPVLGVGFVMTKTFLVVLDFVKDLNHFIGNGSNLLLV